MNKEICDYYEPKKKNYKNKVCKHFTGDVNNKRDISRCRHNCSIIDCQSLMGHSSYKRGKGGAIKQKK